MRTFFLLRDMWAAHRCSVAIDKEAFHCLKDVCLSSIANIYGLGDLWVVTFSDYAYCDFRTRMHAGRESTFLANASYCFFRFSQFFVFLCIKKRG